MPGLLRQTCQWVLVLLACVVGFSEAGCASDDDTTIQGFLHGSDTDDLVVWYPDSTDPAFTECDGTTDCSKTTLDLNWEGNLDDCAALCANFAFTNFTSSTCYKALVFTDSPEGNCNLFLWNAMTEPYTGSYGAVVLSDCALLTCL